MMMYYILRVMPAVALLGALMYSPIYFANRHKPCKQPLIRHLVLYALICCALSIIYLTILWYYPDITFNPSWHSLNLKPFVWLEETYDMGATKMLRQLLLNVVMFVPLGLLLPMASDKLRSAFKTGLVAFAATLTIETLQYFMGRSADIDDVIMNLAGGIIGYLLYAVLNRQFSQSHRWREALGKQA